MRNKSFFTLIKTPFKLLQSVLQSMRVIVKVKPDVVLGMGGYASAPGGVAAWLMGKPLILHEQNAVAGMSNRYLLHLATKVLSAFPGAFKTRKKIDIVGNPLRKEIVSLGLQITQQINTEKERLSKKVLIVGGSLGAQVLNENVPLAMKQLKGFNFQVWHQTGKGNKDTVSALYKATDIECDQYKVTEFIADMAQAYQWADVVICRAGALTVSELATLGKPAIFIPLPHAVDDHQTKNARYLVDRGGAKLIAQKDLTSMQIAQMLNSMFVSEKMIKAMSTAARQAAYNDATEQVAKACQEQVK